MTTNIQSVRSTVLKVKHRMENPSEMPGIPYGFPTLDDMTGGILENELTILGADTGVGKTLLLGQFSLNIARWVREHMPGKVIKIVHCEMTLDQNNMRLATQVTGIPTKKFQSGNVTEEEFKRFTAAMKEIAELPIEYLESPPTFREAEEWIRQNDDCAWWGIDHIQELEVGQGMSPFDTKAIGMKSQMLARLSREVCSGMALSQLVNDVAKREDHRPSKADLFGATMLKAPMSVCILIYRPEIYTQQAADRKSEPRPAHLIVDKNRNGQRTGDIKVLFNPAKAVFVDPGGKK
jgi:replicative DNA helicase